MTTLFPMQILSSSNQANLEAMQSITQTMFNAAERIAALNIGVSRAMIEYASSGANLLQADGWQSALSRQGAGLRPMVETTVGYLRSVQDISVAVQSEISQALSVRAGEAADGMIDLLDKMEKSSPASGIHAVATAKSAISNVRTVYDSMLRTGQQVAEANAATVASAAAAIGVAATTARAKKAA